MCVISQRQLIDTLRHLGAQASRIIAAALLVIAMSMLSAGESQADDQGVTAPPAEQYTVSPGGVDMRTGRYVYRQTDLSAGDTGATRGFSLQRIEEAGLPGHVSPFGNMADNWDITLTERRRNLMSGAVGASGSTDFQVYVNVGGRLETFQAMNLTFDFHQLSRTSSAGISHTGTRGAGGEVYTYVGSDGSIIVFRPLGLIGSSDCSDTVRCAYVSEMLSLDGTRYTFQYDTRTGTGSRARLASVTSNRGYVLLFEHNGPDWNLVTKACLFNTALTSPPTGGSCSVGAIASTSYAYASYGGKNRLSTVVDARLKTWSFTYAADPASPSDRYRMSFYRPGEAAPWLVNLNMPNQNYFLINEDITINQQLFDGTSWTYGYDYSPTEINVPIGQPTHQLAGGYFQDGSGRKTTVKFDFPLVPYSSQWHPIAPSIGQIMSWRFDQERNNISYSLTYTGTYTDSTGTWDRYDATPYTSSTSENFSALLETLQIASLVSCNDCGSPSPYQYVDSYQVTPGPVEVTDPLNRVTRFDYCDKTTVAPDPGSLECIVVGLVQSETDPEGNKTLYKYSNTDIVERRRVAKPGSGLADIVETATYPVCVNLAICHKPLTVTDANGNVTTYTYDQTHGGVLTETGPADANGVQRVKRSAYVQRYARLSNGAGGYVQAATPVWLLSSEKSCNTSATSGGACTAGASDEVTSSYDYGPDSGPNNLWLRGVAVAAGSATLRTCYGYDIQGNKISETSARAGLTVCP